MEERLGRVAVLKSSKISMDSKCSDAFGQPMSIPVVPCRDASNGGGSQLSYHYSQGFVLGISQLFNVGQRDPVLQGYMTEA